MGIRQHIGRATRFAPGIFLMLAIAVFTKGAEDLGCPWWRGVETYLALDPVVRKWALEVFHLNHILLCIILGILIRNTVGLPAWVLPGIRTSRLFIKVGVIFLGSLYSVTELANLGTSAVLLILGFVFATLFFTIWLGQRLGMDAASASVLAAGLAICGVSAVVATAPVARARTTEVVYSIATVLSLGVVFLFTFPTIGTLLGLTPHQFGAWAGTAILNTGQVLAAALAFDPGSVAHPSLSLKTGQIFNLARVLFLPFVVLVVAILGSREQVDDEIKTGFWERFPIFVLGFLAMVFLTSSGLLGATDPPSRELLFIRNLYSWFFAIGLAGLGMQISFAELRKAGGRPLAVGTAVAVLKAALALVVVMLLIPPRP
ncbi:MAG: putative sulfate exporter family transporter [Bacillota bacterium]